MKPKLIKTPQIRVFIVTKNSRFRKFFITFMHIAQAYIEERI